MTTHKHTGRQMKHVLILLASLALCGCAELRGAIKCGSQGTVDYDPSGSSTRPIPHCN